MPITDDPLDRWWVDISSANPERVYALKSALVSFLGFDRGRSPGLAGTGFVIAGTDNVALVITAKHVLSEGILRIQKPAPMHSPSALFIPARIKTPSLDPNKLKTVWLGSEHPGLLNAVHACYNETLDIACCLIMPQQLEPPPFRPTSIPFDTRVPRIGDTIHMVSLNDLDVCELRQPTDFTGVGQLLTLRQGVNIRIGSVTAVYPQGFRQYRWPCFTTSIPAKPGMSGGFVSIPRDGEAVTACGIVCADNSTEAAHNDLLQCGESVIACAWPALVLRVPVLISNENNRAEQTLYDLMQNGRMEKPAEGLDHIDVVNLENGDYRITNRLA